ncbi:MAG: T9SS type A sorting domain-containing protein [Chitinophagaceae bacterium]
MKKNRLVLSAFAALFCFSQVAQAQCTGGRFHQYVFPGTPNLTSNIQYGSNVPYNSATPQNLQLDVYQPAGDNAPLRPLVLVFHGGSFISGSKTGNDVVPLCQDLARLGYVSASVEYRLGMNNFPFPGPNEVDATEAVMRAVQDARAAVRFFRKDAANGNTYKIDTNHIYIAGVSAGGFIALHLAYLDQVSEIPAGVNMNGASLSGGLEGNSGNPGYSSKVKAIINIAGALGDTAWINQGDIPCLSLHGTNDGTVPYGSDVITLAGLFPLMMVHGSSSVTSRLNTLGIENCFEIQEGQGHVPHVSQAAYYDTLRVLSRNFLEHYVCGVPLVCTYNGAIPSSVHDVDLQAQGFDVYPNPTQGVLNLRTSEQNTMNQVRVYNSLGECVYQQALHASQVQLNVSRWANGVYWIQTETTEGRRVRTFVKQD